MIEGEYVDLETIAEGIAKKIRYRGASIKPRDISISLSLRNMTRPHLPMH